MIRPEDVADLQPGDVIRYEPKNRWCHDGYAIAAQQDRGVVLVDTYWTYTGMNSGSVVRPESYEFLCNLDGYEEKPEHEWEKFAEADRLWIPRHANYKPMRLVRKGATPDLATQIENAREQVSDAESKLRSAQWGRDYARQELNKLEALVDGETGQVVQ